MDKIFKITENDFGNIFGEITPRTSKKIKEFDLSYTKISSEKRDGYIRQIISGLLNSEFEAVGEHKKEKWNEAWAKNLDAFQKKERNPLTPYYFRETYAGNIVRWRQELVKSIKPGFGYEALAIILEWLFEKYMKTAKTVYEFGCGSGYHLVQLQEVNPGAKIVGLDWAESSQKVLKAMGDKGILKNLEARQFDFYSPDYSLDLGKDSVVYTVHALEQVGNKHGEFVKYLLDKKPAICVHVEPIVELLDPNNLLDYLSIEYFKARSYLLGFLTHLRELEKEGKVKIHKAQRTFLGANMYVDHYSAVVWSPV